MKISDRIKTVFNSSYKPKKMTANKKDRKITTVSIDRELWKKARGQEINISMAAEFGINALLEIKKAVPDTPTTEEEPIKEREEAPAPEELI